MRGQWQKWFYYYNKCQEAKEIGGLAISVTNYSFNREIQNATATVMRYRLYVLSKCKYAKHVSGYTHVYTS